MSSQLERKHRTVRWAFNLVSSLVIIAFGLVMLVLRFGYAINPFADKFWLAMGLVFGYGAMRLAFLLWRKQHLYDDLENQSENES